MENADRNAEAKLTIMDAALKLLESKPFEQVKVNDLCEACGISRSTFYRNFQGVHSIPLWYQRYTADITLHQIGRYFTCTEGHELSLQLLSRGAAFYEGRGQWLDTEFRMQCINNHVNAMRDMLQERGIAVSASTEYKLRGTAVSANELVAQWMSARRDLSIKELVGIIVQFVPNDLRKVLDSPTQSAPVSTLLALSRLTSNRDISG